MKRTPLQRRTPIRKRRPGVRRGEPTKEEKEAIRLRVYQETGGRCEMSTSPQHLSGILPFDGEVMWRWHLVHKRAKRRFGWDRSNLMGGCSFCHEASHNANGKPVPAKQRMTAE